MNLKGERLNSEPVNRLKPPSSKGQYLKNVALSSTMGPGIKVDISSLKEK